VSEPGAPAHLEIYSDNEAYLETISEAAKGLGLVLSISHRKRHPAAYSKKLGTISDFLAKTGAHRAALRFEEQSVVSSIRADANRRTNFDQANAARCSRAAGRQIKAIKELQSLDSWSSVSRNLSDIAELRLKYPSATLQELGRKVDPPLSKSAVNHRLRRLVKMAEQRVAGF
jgi:DNA-binding protein WhiA